MARGVVGRGSYGRSHAAIQGRLVGDPGSPLLTWEGIFLTCRSNPSFSTQKLERVVAPAQAGAAWSDPGSPTQQFSAAQNSAAACPSSSSHLCRVAHLHTAPPTPSTPTLPRPLRRNLLIMYIFAAAAFVAVAEVAVKAARPLARAASHKQ